MAPTTQDPSFGALLRHLRTQADLTQEELAERAQLSARGLSDLERSVNTKPRPFTLSRLADALDLGPAERARFERAAAAGTIDPCAEDALPHGNFLGAVPEGRLFAREVEMRRICSVLDSATEGNGHVLLFGGGRGSGKTRLLQELAVGARERGYVVLTKACYPSELSIPYQPMLDALSELPSKAPTAARADAERGWRTVQRRAARAPEDMEVHAEKTAWSKRVASAISNTLLRTSHATPLALILDDLQWADEESLQLIHHLVRVTRSSRIVIAGAFSDVRLAEDHPKLSDMLQLLTHDRLGEYVAVRRLSPEETAKLIANLMEEGSVGEEFAGFAYRRTKGNPRLIEAMVWSLGGRLELRGEIGSGSTGRVFRAFDRRIDMEVAAKLVLAREGIELDDLLRFQQEGKLLGSLDHPNIVHVYDTFAEEHAACIIMELLDGPSLAKVLQEGPIPLFQARHVGVQVASALSYAHAQSIVHRDIKPDNIMILAENQVKVTDFGIARILKTDNSLATMATTGMRAGTPSYMAPEQIAGKEIDGRTDVYALGAMLFHMVTGRPPFEGNDKLSIAVKHLQEQPVPPSSINPCVPDDWDALILRALAKEPRKRFQSAREMGQAIDELRDRDSPAAHTTKQGKPAVAGGLLVALLIAALLVWRWPVTNAHASVSSQIKTYLSALADHDQLGGTVLVSQKGKILVDSAYGLADKSAGIRNGRNTKYGVSGVSQSFSVADVLQSVEQGALRWNDPICKYLPGKCVPSWRRITVRMVVDGTADFPAAGFGIAGNSPAQSLATCEKAPLDAKPGSRIEYQNCGDIVLGLLVQKSSVGSWGQAGAFLLPGLTNTGQLTNSLSSPERALAYDGPKLDPATVFNDTFSAYSTAPDILAYDNALFGGRFLSPHDTAVMFQPRAGIPNGAPGVDPTDYGVANAGWGYDWKVGRVLGHKVAYTLGSMSYFQAANVRFQQAGVTVIVLANDVRDNVWDIATHAAAFVFGQSPKLSSPLPPVVLLRRPSWAPTNGHSHGQTSVDLEIPRLHSGSALHSKS